MDEFAKPLLDLLDQPFDYTKDFCSFCRSLYITHQYHRLISFFETQENPQQIDITIQYWYLKSLLKVFRHGDAEVYIKSLSEDLQTHSKILYIQGLCKIRTMDYQSASELLVNSFKIDPSFFEPLSKLLSHHLISEANYPEIFSGVSISPKYRKELDLYASLFWFLSGDNSASFAITSDLLESNPTSSKVIIVYISHCLSLNKKQELFSIAQKLLAVAPQSYLSSFATAAHFSIINRTDSARRLLWYSLQLSPSFAPSWLLYAITYWYDGDSRSALGVVQVAARAFPELELLHIWAGKLCVDCGDCELALAHYKTCYQSSYILNEIGCVLMRMNKLEEAVLFFDQAIQKQDSISTYSLNSALAHRRLGDFDGAMGIYLEVERKEPENLQCELGLAFTFQLMEEYMASYERYRTVLRIDPHNSFAKEMINHVSSKLASFDVFEDMPFENDSSVRFEEMFGEWQAQL